MTDDYKSAKSALAYYHGVSADNIIIGSGCSELIYLAIRTLRPRKVLIPTPAVNLYLQACKQYGCEFVTLELEKSNEFDIDVEKLILQTQGVDMIILCNPNNPTSRIIEKSKMYKILDYCQEKGIYLVIDEAYADFTGVDISVAKQVERYANIVIVRTLANYFALSGLRFGYAISCEGLCELLHMNQIPGTVSLFALNACEILLRDFKYIKNTKAWLHSEPKRFFHLISTLGGLTAYKPYANFIFIELEQIPSATLCDRLHNIGIKVCNCNKMGNLDGQYIRISIKDRKSNDKFLDKFSRCLL